MNSNDKYNMLVNEIANTTSKDIKAESFGLEYQEFKAIIDEIESDGLFKEGHWLLSGLYKFMGLTFQGRNFIENSDKKEYHKIEKTEINNNHNINVSGDNLGNIISGNNNTINSEFNKNFDDLINEINKSNLQNKELIIEELNNKKDDEKSLNNYLLSLLKIGVKASISTIIGSLL